ncbi:MAG: TonB-dependent receptor [Bacteroidia bacterium]|nr:TonB-dependent receptor [Bacteroidia bacterium]
MRSIFIILLSAFIGLHLCAQAPQGNRGPNNNGSGILTGTVTDAETTQAVEYATVSLYKSKDSSLVTDTVTDHSGKFRLEKIQYGSYYAMVNFIGYKKKKVTGIMINPKIPVKDVGRISISPSTTALSEIDVTAEKKLVEFTLDKKVINVEKNLSTAGGSAADVIQNVPSVTVDIDGTVSLRGSTNVTVLVDGKPSGLSGLSGSAILDQIPASSIDRIEVITNPSAKYDPDGMSGIINIILKKKIEKGYNGMFSVTAGTRNKYNSSLNLNFRHNNYNLFGSWDMRYNERTGTSHTTRQSDIITSLNKDSITHLTSDGHSDNQRLSNNFKAGFDYSFNDFNSFTFSVLNGQGSNNNNEFDHSFVQDSVYHLMYLYNTINKERNTNNSTDYNFDYKKTFLKKGEELTADVILSKSDNVENGYVSTQYFDNYNNPVDSGPDLQNTITNEKYRVLTIQADYTNPLSEKARIDLGFKSVIRSNDNNYIYNGFSFGNVNDWNMDSLMSNHFVYNEQIHSAYVIYSDAWSNLEYQLGLRFEEASTRAEQKTSDSTFTNNYFNVFPTLHLNYKLDENNSVQLSYSRRVNRPNAWQLNPFVDRSQPKLYSYGNPKLTPEYVNAYETGYQRYWGKTSFNITAFYRQISHIIQRYTIMDTTGTQYTTFMNLSKGTSYGIEGVVQADFRKWWNINLTYSYFRNIIEGTADGTALTNSNYTWTTRLNSNMSIMKLFDFQIIGNYRAPMVNIQGTMQASYNVDVAMKKDFLKGMLTVNLRASDIFNTQQFNMHRYGDGFIIDMKRKRESRLLYFGVTYKINGGLKQKEKKKQEEEQRQDTDF